MSIRKDKSFIEEEEIDWKNNIGQDNEDVVLKRLNQNSVITRDDYLKAKVIDEVKDLFLKLIPKGQIKVRYDLDMFDGVTVKALQLMMKCLSSSKNILCDSSDDLYYIHLKKDGPDSNKIFSMLITWEVPVHRINTKSSLLKNFENLERFTRYNGLKFEKIFNKSSFQVSTHIGLSLSMSLKNEVLRSHPISLLKKEEQQ